MNNYIQRRNSATFKRCQERYDAMEHPDYYNDHDDEPVCCVCGEWADKDGYDGPVCDNCLKAPKCPTCGNNRQVWVNQDTEKMTCHRFGCHTVIETK